MPGPTDAPRNPIERLFEGALTLPNVSSISEPTARATTLAQGLGRITGEAERHVDIDWIDDRFAFPLVEEDEPPSPTEVGEEFTVRLEGKSITDNAQGRFINYAYQRVQELANGTYAVDNENPPTSGTCRNRDEINKRHEQHTGLIVSQTIERRQIVQLKREIRPVDGVEIDRFTYELPEFFAVLVVFTAGQSGNVTTPIDAQYEIYDLDGQLLADSQAFPQEPEIRTAIPIAGFPVGRWVLPSSNSVGIARWNPTDMTIKLWQVGEFAATAACPK